MKQIKKRADPVVRRLRKIRDRDEKSLIFCEGINLLDELLKSRCEIKSIYISTQLKNEVKDTFNRYHQAVPDPFVLSPDVMAFCSDLKSPPGIIVVATAPKNEVNFDELKENPLVVVAHGIQQPQNIGAIFRTAEAAGVTEIWLTPPSADPFNPKSLRASAGSVLRVPFRKLDSLSKTLDKLNEIHVKPYALTQNGTESYSDIDWVQPVSLIFGPEGKGFSNEELDLIGSTVKIQMKNQVESLNVAVSAGICLFEANRQRKKV